MATLFCTKALQRAYRLKPGHASPDPSPRLGNWYANTVRVDRRSAVLFTNEKTLFSFVMLRGKTRTLEELHYAFMRGLAMSLALEGHNGRAIERVVNEYGHLPAVGAAKNQKLIGSMNHIARDFAYFVYHEGGLNACDLGDVTHRINNTPWGATGYAFASDLVKELATEGAH